MLRLVLIMFVFVANAYAFEGYDLTDPNQAYEYRQKMMKANAKYMKAMGKAMKQGMQDTAIFVEGSQFIAKSYDQLEEMFPEGSDIGDSEAKENIWTHPEMFAQAVEMAQGKAQALVVAVESGDKDAMIAAFQGVGQTCKKCHEFFRE